jgi:hypothetical protein
MKTRTERILVVLKVIAYLAMIGFAFNCGSQIISLVVSFYNPAASKQILGVPQSLSGLQQYNQVYFAIAMCIIIVLSAMFVYLWILIIQLLSKLNLSSPFTMEVSRKLERIAILLLVIWLFSFTGEDYARWLTKDMGEQLSLVKVENAYLFTSGIVYIISQIFRHGVELQEENQQTI